MKSLKFNQIMQLNKTLTFILLFVSLSVFAQIDNQTYEIEKNKKIELPSANRLYGKQQPITNPEDEGKMTFEFRSPKFNTTSPKSTPAILPVEAKNKDEEDGKANLDNFLKIGAGNYGKIYGEAFIGGQSGNDLSGNVHFKHLSNQTGPVDEKNSASSDNDLKVGGQYQASSFKISGNASYSRQNYFFYGNRTSKLKEIKPDSIRQTLNIIGAELSIDNIDNTTLIDYTLKTGIHRLTDKYNASETDWGTVFTSAIPITSNFYALVGAEAYVSQLADSESSNRNLYAVKPAFKYVHPNFSITAAFRAVNETDSRLKINRTVGFPILEVDVSPFAGVHVFAGLDGNINRNTLRSLLGENRWLAPNVVVANTEKNKDIYGGFKGELGSGLQFEGKVSVATYKNFYVFNNSLTDTSKFSILYDAEYINITTVSAQLGYSFGEIGHTNLRADFYDYGIKRLESAWHRPKAMITWNNSVVFSKKLFATIDVYYINGLKAKNFQTNQTIDLKDIIDCNLKVDYLLTRNFSAFVSVNNLLGKNYERYKNYSQQGLNFLGGLSFSF